MTGKGRARARMIGNILIGLGVLLMVGVGAAYGYSFYLDQQARSDPWLAQVQSTWEAPTATAEPLPTQTPTTVATAQSTPRPTMTPSPTPTATPRAYPSAVGMRIPAIGLDSKVVEVGISDGEFEVPRFYVGHYRHTPKPGERGNGVYTGHVESLDKGQVFANLPKVKVGQDINLYTPEGIWQYRITRTKTVPNTDTTVMEQTDDHRITVITCTGTFDWSSRQYTHRFIVTAELVNEDGPKKP